MPRRGGAQELRRLPRSPHPEAEGPTGEREALGGLTTPHQTPDRPPGILIDGILSFTALNCKLLEDPVAPQEGDSSAYARQRPLPSPPP